MHASQTAHLKPRPGKSPQTPQKRPRLPLQMHVAPRLRPRPCLCSRRRVAQIPCATPTSSVQGPPKLKTTTNTPENHPGDGPSARHLHPTPCASQRRRVAQNHCGAPTPTKRLPQNLTTPHAPRNNALETTLPTAAARATCIPRRAHPSGGGSLKFTVPLQHQLNDSHKTWQRHMHPGATPSKPPWLRPQCAPPAPHAMRIPAAGGRSDSLWHPNIN